MAAANASVWSADGGLLALLSAGVATVYDTDTEEQARVAHARRGAQAPPRPRTSRAARRRRWPGWRRRA